MIALSFGWTLSASTVASAKNGRNDSLTPSLASNPALARSLSLAIAVTSASTTVVSWAEVCSDSTMRCAMTWRDRDSFSVLPRRLDGTIAGRPVSAAGAGPALAAAAGAAAGAAGAAAGGAVAGGAAAGAAASWGT